MKFQFNDSKFWHRFSLAAAAATLALSISPALFAQSATPGIPTADPVPPTNQGEGPGPAAHRELNNFDQLLQQHPEFAEQVRQDPSLLNNPTYLSNHPELQSWLSSHPGVAQQLKNNPQAFVEHERNYNQHLANEHRDQVHSYDEVLKNHPELAEQLTKNPALANDPTFLKNHPQFANYLQTHPAVAEDLKNHPEAFQQKANDYAKHQSHQNQQNQRQQHQTPQHGAPPPRS